MNTGFTDPQRTELIQRALEVRKNAYAKYSEFSVGASLLTSDGKFFDGVNVENASFGLTVCAERSAVFAAVSAGQRKIIAIAIATDGGHAPCGACRQVLSEFDDDMAILMVDTSEPSKILQSTLNELLPGRFVFPSEKK